MVAQKRKAGEGKRTMPVIEDNRWIGEGATEFWKGSRRLGEGDRMPMGDQRGRKKGAKETGRKAGAIQ
jgi:hypothetical protein